jgi:hypothetical protein
MDEFLITSNKVANINITNRELIHLIKNESEFNYLATLHDCKERNESDDAKFQKCVLQSICPEETQNFNNCVKTNKQNTHLCINDFFKLQDCMKYHTNRFLSIMQKVNKI